MTESTPTTTPAVEVLKGAREKILVRPWENKGRHCRSFALKPAEARELAAALETMAAQVEAPGREEA